MQFPNIPPLSLLIHHIRQKMSTTKQKSTFSAIHTASPMEMTDSHHPSLPILVWLRCRKTPSFAERIPSVFFVARSGLLRVRIPCGQKTKPMQKASALPGSGRRIRTLTNRVRVCRATLTQFRYNKLFYYIPILQKVKRFSKIFLNKGERPPSPG